ncbi:gustatory receptor family protein [Christensenellaceae bacterium OttesenSCG-928-L17]|nr:gustatory receptor family protein [Christensenellaceae bacterium OttesenSCG-928-L17]
MDKNSQNPPNSPQKASQPAVDFSGFDPIDHPYDPAKDPKITPTPPNNSTAANNTPPQPATKSNFKKNTLLSAIITIISAFVFTPLILSLSGKFNYYYMPLLEIAVYLSPFIISIIMWFYSLIKKKNGAHGWIIGPLIVVAIVFTIFGGCMLLLFY